MLLWLSAPSTVAEHDETPCGAGVEAVARANGLGLLGLCTLGLARGRSLCTLGLGRGPQREQLHVGVLDDIGRLVAERGADFATQRKGLRFAEAVVARELRFDVAQQGTRLGHQASGGQASTGAP